MATADSFRRPTPAWAGIALWALILIGCALVAWGMAHTPNQMQWRMPALILGIAAAAFAVHRWIGRADPLITGWLLAGILLLICGELSTLVTLAVLAFSSTLLGHAMLQRMGARQLGGLHAMLLGLALLGTLVGWLAHWPLASRATYGALLAAPIIVWRNQARTWVRAGWDWLCTVRRQWEQRTAQSVSPRNWQDSVLDFVLVGLAMVYVLTALMPEVGHDALAMHLFIPDQVAFRRQWKFDGGQYVFSLMPLLVDWQYAVVNMFAGEVGTRVFNVVATLVLLVWLRDLATACGANRRGVRWGQLILLSTPLCYTEASSLFIESTWTAYLLAALVPLVRAQTSPSPDQPTRELEIGDWWGLALLLGAALACKAITLPFGMGFVVLTFWPMWQTRIRLNLPRMLAGAVALLLLLGITPFLTAWWKTGNPVFPFFNAVFKSPLWYQSNFDPTAFGKGISWRLPYDIVFHSDILQEGLPGAGGFQYLLLGACAVALLLGEQRKRIGLCALWAGLGWYAVFHSTAYLRYVFPAYVVLAALFGTGLSIALNAWHARTGRTTLLALGWGTILLNTMHLNAAAFYGDLPLRSIWSDTARREYLKERQPTRHAVDVVNALNTARTPVVVLAQPLVAGLRADALYASWYNVPFESRFKSKMTDADLTSWMTEDGIEFFILDATWAAKDPDDEVRLAQVDRISDPVWSAGGVKIRRLRLGAQFQTELLSDPEFQLLTPWQRDAAVIPEPTQHSVRVNVSHPAIQTVAIKPGRHYRQQVQARCHAEASRNGALGRIQVNWSDASGKFLTASIATFACAPEWSQQEMTVVAPELAKFATVYASGHGAEWVEFRKVSFAQ